MKTTFDYCRNAGDVMIRLDMASLCLTFLCISGKVKKIGKTKCCKAYTSLILPTN